MGKRFAISRWLVLALVVATLVSPLAAPGLLGGGSSQPAALAQDNETGQVANTGDSGDAEIPTETPTDESADTGDQSGDTGDQTGDTGDQTGDTGDDTGDMDGDGTDPAQPPTEVVDEGQDGTVDTEEPSETVAPSDTPTEEVAPVEVAEDEVVIPAALPDSVLNFTCIVDPANPNLRTIIFQIQSGGAGYGNPTTTVSLTDVNGNSVNPSPPMPSNPYTGTGTWTFGPSPGIAAINADANYPLTAGGSEQASLEGQCVPEATPIPTNTRVPSNTPTQTPEGWTPSPTNTRTPSSTPTETPEGWTPSPTNTRVPSSTPTQTPEGWTPSPTITRTPSLTPTFETTGTPIPLGDFRFTCGTSSQPGNAIYGLAIGNLGAGITAVVSWTLVPPSGPNVYGSAQVPPAVSPLFQINGNFTIAYANAVYYSGNDIIAVANVQGTCKVTPGSTWTATATATATPIQSNTPVNTATATQTNTPVNTATSTASNTPTNTATATATNTPSPIVPVAPTVTANNCVGGRPTASTITPATTAGLNYVVTQQPTSGNGWTYKVTATITGSGLTWGNLTGTGWVKVDDDTATFTAVAPPKPCIETIPAKPKATDGVCTGGTWTEPTVEAVDGDGYSAVVTQQPTLGNGWQYVVTATIADGYSWDDLAGSGWVRVNNSTATYTKTVEPNLCTPLVPTAPKATDGVCTGGAWTAPTVEAVQGTGYTAVVTQTPNAGNGWTYIVTATIKDGYEWGDLTTNGWAKSSNTVATFTKTVNPNECTPLVPATPDAHDGVCTGGTWTAPTVAAVQGDGYTAVVTQEPNAGNGWTYIVTATIKDGYAWGDLTANGWAKSSNTVATFTKTVEPHLCKDSNPIAPTATDGTCLGGVWTAPTVTANQGTGYTAAVTQYPNAGNGWTYIVTATIEPGYAWNLTGTSWVKVNNATATYTSTVQENACIEIFPPRPAPEVGTNVCKGGTFVPPVIVPGTTTGVTYKVVQQPTAKNRWTYIVTATIDVDGIGWGDLSGTGWVIDSPTKATITGTVVVKSCYVPNPPKPHGPHGPHGPGAVTVLPSTGTGTSSDSMFMLFGMMALAAASAAAAGLFLRRKPQ